MNKPEYTDLYRFLVSIGTVFIAFSLLLPWLLLREPFDSNLSNGDIATYTQTAQKLILFRQNIGLWFYENLVILTIIPAVLGLAIFIYGYYLWRQKQSLNDKKEALEVEKLDKEVHPMTPEQIAIQYVNEAAMEPTFFTSTAVKTTNQIDSISEFARIEQKVFEKFDECFGKNNIRRHYKIYDSNIDLLLRVRNTQRCIIDIKTTNNINSIPNMINNAQAVLEKSIINYRKIPNIEDIYGIGFIFISDEIKGSLSEMDKKVSFSKSNNIHVRIFLYTEEEFINLTYKSLEEIVLNK